MVSKHFGELSRRNARNFFGIYFVVDIDYSGINF